MTEDLINEVVRAAHIHSVLEMGEDLIDGIDDIDVWLETADTEAKLTVVLSYLQETVQ